MDTNATPEPSLQPGHAAVDAVRDAWVAAVANQNANALRDLVTEDYEVWAHAAAPIIGPDAVVAAMSAALARYSIEQRFEPIETVIAGDWAFQRGVERMHVAPTDGGPARDIVQRALVILRQGADGRWRYARGFTNGLPPNGDTTDNASIRSDDNARARPASGSDAPAAPAR